MIPLGIHCQSSLSKFMPVIKVNTASQNSVLTHSYWAKEGSAGAEEQSIHHLWARPNWSCLRHRRSQGPWFLAIRLYHSCCAKSNTAQNHKVHKIPLNTRMGLCTVSNMRVIVMFPYISNSTHGQGFPFHDDFNYMTSSIIQVSIHVKYKCSWLVFSSHFMGSGIL